MTMKTLCHKQRLFRGIKLTSLEEAVTFVQAEIVDNGQNQGYQLLNLRGVQSEYIVSYNKTNSQVA